MWAKSLIATDASLTKTEEGVYSLCCMKDTCLRVQGDVVITVDELPFADGEMVSAGNHRVCRVDR